MRLLVPFAVVAGFVLLGDLSSGPQVGDKLPALKAHAFSGPEAGKEFDVLKATKGKPALLIFVHKITRPTLQFLRPVDEYAVKEEGKLAAHILWLGDMDEAQKFLKRAEKSLNLQTPIGIPPGGKDGPGTYGLNADVGVTVLLAKDGKVVANFAITDPNGKDAPKVIRTVAKLLAKKT